MLIAQGVFRSGTTVLFRALRQDEERRCYYEPLHPNLLDHVQEARTTTPRHAKSPLYAEFTPLLNPIETVFSPAFALNNAVLDSEDNAPAMSRYLHLLAEAPSSAVLQMNRGFWMSAWLRQQFPSTAFLHLVRDPRSVVWSQMTTQSGDRVRMNWPLLQRRFFNFSSGDLSNVFSPRAYCGAYHVNEYREIGRQKLGRSSHDVAMWAQARLRATRESPPFVQALALWGAQAWVCHQQAQAAFGDRYCLIRYEDLCAAPEHTLSRVYHQLFDHPPPDSVLAYSRDHVHANRIAGWRQVDMAEKRFRQGLHEAGLERVLEAFGYPLAANKEG
jgi:hypothetical protein